MCQISPSGVADLQHRTRKRSKTEFCHGGYVYKIDVPCNHPLCWVDSGGFGTNAHHFANVLHPSTSLDPSITTTKTHANPINVYEKPKMARRGPIEPITYGPRNAVICIMVAMTLYPMMHAIVHSSIDNTYTSTSGKKMLYSTIGKGHALSYALDLVYPGPYGQAINDCLPNDITGTIYNDPHKAIDILGKCIDEAGAKPVYDMATLTAHYGMFLSEDYNLLKTYVETHASDIAIYIRKWAEHEMKQFGVVVGNVMSKIGLRARMIMINSYLTVWEKLILLASDISNITPINDQLLHSSSYDPQSASPEWVTSEYLRQYAEDERLRQRTLGKRNEFDLVVKGLEIIGYHLYDLHKSKLLGPSGIPRLVYDTGDPNLHNKFYADMDKTHNLHQDYGYQPGMTLMDGGRPPLWKQDLKSLSGLGSTNHPPISFMARHDYLI